MPFSRWMELALFHPTRGYYASQISGIGRHGDFTTSSAISSALGVAIASWIKARLEEMPEVGCIIEVGAGDGSMAKTVLDSLGWWRRRKLRMLVVERSEPLREKQQAKLAGRASWFPTMEEALKSCDGNALIYHNELLDAFPVTLVQWSVGRRDWDEVNLLLENGKLQEELLPLAWFPNEIDSYSVLKEWSALQPPPYPEQRCEISKSVFEWIQDWSYHWRRGAMLTIDYGDTFPALFAKRPHGTLRSYLAQQRLTGQEIYQNMGRQDVTADVNFTDLAHWGRLLGWDNKPLKTQREFIEACAPELLSRAGSDSAIAFLTNPDGAGTAFKVLEQEREFGPETRRLRRITSTK